MVGHSEFPWGPENVPGLLTPLGAVGWLVAAVLAVAVMALTRPGRGRHPKKPSDEIRQTYRQIRAAADYAMSLDNYSVLAGAQTLREVIQTRLGRVLGLGSEFSVHLKAIAEALDENAGHGGGHGHGHGKPGGKGGKSAAGAHAGHQGAAAARGSALAAVGNNVHGPSITVNVGVADRSDPHAAVGEPAADHGADHDEHDEHDEHDHHDTHDKPLSLEERLVLVRKRVGEFQAWWRHEAARIDQMEAALKDLTDPAKLNPRTGDMIKPFAEKPEKES